MILRVYRAKTTAGARAILLAHLRDTVYPANVHTPGLRTFQAGIAEAADGSLEFVLITTWEDFEALRRAIGDDLFRPAWLEAVRDHLVPSGADHYELVGEELRGLVPIAGGALRIMSGRLDRSLGETFFDFARRAQAAQLDSGLILVSHIGRRMADAGEEAVYVTVWRDADAPAATSSPVAGADRDEWQRYFEDVTFEAYEALARVAPRPGESMAVLLADDERRYLFATPVAGRLFGRPTARLLGQRIDDVTAPTNRADVERMWQTFLRDGVQAGPFELARLDGAVVKVRYEAHANTPWPGVHASVLSDPSIPVHFDDALAAAGLVARYVPGKPGRGGFRGPSRG